MKKTVNKESTGQLTWRLLVICMVAAILLGATYAVTKDPIAAQDKIKLQAACKETLPDAAEFKDEDIASLKSQNGWQEAYNDITGVIRGYSNGKNAGTIINITTKGYNSGIKLTVGIGADNVIKGISITEHNETAGLGAKATAPEFRGQFNGKSIETPLTVVKGEASGDNEIEAITSSTLTSKGVTKAVNTAVEFYKQYFSGKE